MKYLPLMFVCLLTACGIEQVDEGYRGIKTNWGRVVGEPLNPGLYFYLPVASDIFEMNVREEKLENTTIGYTKDTQIVTVNFALTYFPDPLKIGDIYSQFGKSWDEKLIIPSTIGSLKDAVGKYVADDLISNREAFKKYAQDKIIEALDPRGITATKLEITNLDFEDGYEKAVEAKVVASQRALEAKNKTIQIQEEAKQTVEKAKAEAESMRIRANALSQNKSLVEYEAVQKWNGVLPANMYGSAPMPFIRVDSQK